MSLEAIAWAWKQTAVTQASARFTLLALADEVWVKDRDRTWPGQAKLARKTGLTDRTIRDALKALEAAGLIHQAGKMGAAIIYRLAMTGATTSPSDPASDAETASASEDGNAEAASSQSGSSFRSIRKPFPDNPETASDRPGNQEETRKEPGRDQRARRARRHPLPRDWQPSLDGRLRATAAGYDADALAEGFRAYHEAKGTLNADWDAAFRTWIMLEPKFQRPTRRAGEADVAGAIALLRRDAARSVESTVLDAFVPGGLPQ